MKKSKKKKRGRKKGSKVKILDEKIFKDLEPEKQKLIEEIWKLQPEYKSLEVCLSKYNIEDLKKHIELFKRKRRKCNE